MDPPAAQDEPAGGAPAAPCDCGPPNGAAAPAAGASGSGGSSGGSGGGDGVVDVDVDGGAGAAGAATAGAAKRKRVSEGALRTVLLELDCTICAKLLHEPVTTPCGHTFCRGCLARALDFRDACPLCRCVVHLSEASLLPVTRALHAALGALFPAEAAARAAEAAAAVAGGAGGGGGGGGGDDATRRRRRLPLFPLNAVVFPGQTFTMNIYEARYRLMLRRVMAGAREFGLVALKPAAGGFAALCEVGSVLRVERAHRMPDGRSIIETVAQHRFRVLDRAELDGYLVGRTEPFEDAAGLAGEKVRDAEARARQIIAALMAKSDPAQPAALAGLHDALRRTGAVPAESEGPSALGLWLAGVLVADKRERQRLLEMNDAAQRLTEMTKLLEEFRNSVLSAGAGAGGSASANRECCVQ